MDGSGAASLVEPEEYGVLRLETVPQGIVAQHLMPFRGEREYADHVA